MCGIACLSKVYPTSLPLLLSLVFSHPCGQALERQKEYFDCIRNERDELRDELADIKGKSKAGEVGQPNDKKNKGYRKELLAKRFLLWLFLFFLELSLLFCCYTFYFHRFVFLSAFFAVSLILISRFFLFFPLLPTCAWLLVTAEFVLDPDYISLNKIPNVCKHYHCSTWISTW